MMLSPNISWTNSKNILKVCRNLILKNKEKPFQLKMVNIIAQECIIGRILEFALRLVKRDKYKGRSSFFKELNNLYQYKF